MCTKELSIWLNPSLHDEMIHVVKIILTWIIGFAFSLKYDLKW